MARTSHAPGERNNSALSNAHRSSSVRQKAEKGSNQGIGSKSNK